MLAKGPRVVYDEGTAAEAMTASVPSSEEALERLKRVYFNDPGREVEFRAGELVMTQGVENRRIYLVKEGALVAYRREAAAGVESLPEDSTGRSYEVFRSGPGSFVGVHAFFSGTFCSNTDVVAVEPTRLAYVDDTTPIIDEAGQGDFLHQFVPVLIHELFVRNSRIYARATEKEEALRMLSRAEMSATLAQLTAGIAHELNNAVGVITSRMQFVAEQLTYCLAEENPLNSKLFTLGYVDKSHLSAAELRNLSRRYERELGICQAASKVLAHLAPNQEELKRYDKKFLRNIDRCYRFWELGHDLRDMQMAAKHAAGIVKGVKRLGRASTEREPGVDVADTVQDAVNLLANMLKRVTLRTELAPLPGITADSTELVQVWTNIIKNACDAMQQAATPQPTVTITADVYHAEGITLLPEDYIRVSISNNGPEIPPEIREKIFQPNFTTKKQGLDFGLGLGLAIVRRVVDSYAGTIALESKEGETTFTICLPVNPLLQPQPVEST